jgi:hypothetical protein
MLRQAQNPLVMKGLTAVSWGGGRIDLFWVGDDGGLWHRAWSAGSWLPDERLGGHLTSAPAVVSWAANEMQVFVVARDGHLSNIYWDGTAWHHWVDMGGDFAAGAEVAASTSGANRIDVFVNSAGELWHRWWDGTQWVDWQREDEPA